MTSIIHPGCGWRSYTVVAYLTLAENNPGEEKEREKERKKKAGQPGVAERAGKVAVQNRTEGTLPVACTSTGG